MSSLTLADIRRAYELVESTKPSWDELAKEFGLDARLGDFLVVPTTEFRELCEQFTFGPPDWIHPSDHAREAYLVRPRLAVATEKTVGIHVGARFGAIRGDIV